MPVRAGAARARATYRQGVGKGSYNFRLGHSSTLHRPADGQFQLLKGAEEDQVVTEVIRGRIGRMHNHAFFGGLPPVGRK